MDSTTMKGTVQCYFDRAFDEMTDKELKNGGRSCAEPSRTMRMRLS